MVDRRLHSLSLRIYYEDTDFSGAVYHASYLRFFERGRTEWLRDLGVDQGTAFEARPPVTFVVTRLSIAYRRPAHMDDVITIRTQLVELRGASLVLAQRASRGAEVVAEAEVTVASLSGGRPVRLPRAIAEGLSTVTPSSQA
ncbi:MAG: tol-pal system-associated acyl-CoA thioesterase [Hyphomicrobiales bacterium]|nr:tol-pal system-associated acyl-CoA thioesterase [Hyphomicrobiales bacterium]MBV9112192.1 tol-pal system-associated acyl-CoA thioesterase [Hyphomicrobiales bacterium]MBV9517756.1 tol-pal system-associated acyl-CoA thioesterase [Hyphomicrobiales bacterium]